jgi:hypothetical protein
MRVTLIRWSTCLALIGLQGCSSKPGATRPVEASPTHALPAPAEATPNTTDILSVDEKAGTFEALVRRDHTTSHVLAKCGTKCPTVGKNFAGFWSLPPSQVGWVVLKETETEGLHTQ